MSYTLQPGTLPARVAPAARTGGADSAPLRVALWSDGELVIEQGVETHRYSAHETRAIVRYLEQLGERVE